MPSNDDGCVADLSNGTGGRLYAEEYDPGESLRFDVSDGTDGTETAGVYLQRAQVAELWDRLGEWLRTPAGEAVTGPDLPPEQRRLYLPRTYGPTERLEGIRAGRITPDARDVAEMWHVYAVGMLEYGPGEPPTLAEFAAWLTAGAQVQW